MHFKGGKVADIPVKPISEGAPVLKRPMRRPERGAGAAPDLGRLKDVANPLRALKGLLGSLNLCSREWIYHQYDHMVRTNTIVRPGSDAAVIRIKGSPHALALTTDCNSRYCKLDPRAGARLAVAEAARNLACSGRGPPGAHRLPEFRQPRAAGGDVGVLGERGRHHRGVPALEIAVVSGNVSFYNETEGKGIYPTPTIGMIGIIEDAQTAVQSSFQKDGDLVVLLGRMGEELGGSEYLAQVHGLEAGLPPELDLDLEEAVQNACIEAIGEELVSSAHDCSDGGFAVALAECCFGRDAGWGAEVEIPAGSRLDGMLFGETQSRILLSLPRASLARLEKICEEREAPLAVLGKVGGSRLKITVGGETALQATVAELRKPWRDALPEWMG